jgi:hypothetical protein
LSISSVSLLDGVVFIFLTLFSKISVSSNLFAPVVLGVLLSPGFAVVCGGVWWWGNSRTEECPKMEKIISQVA